MLAGQSISTLGSAVTQIALPTVAVLLLHASPLQLGILMALQRIPFPILALFVGVWVDRLPRRRVMIISDIGRAAVLATIPISAATGFLGLPLLYVVALTSGVLQIFFDLSYLSYVPELVGRSELHDANSAIQASSSVGYLAGPGLGGLLIQLVGAARAIGIDAASFVVSFLTLLWMGRDPAPPPRPQSPGMWRELREGFAHVFAHPVLRNLILVFGVVILVGHVGDPNLYPFAYSTLHLTPAILGWLLSVEGLAALIGAFLTPRVTTRFPAGWIMAITGAITGAAFVVISFAGAGPSVLIIGGALIVNGLVDPMNNVTQWSLRQLLTPDHLQGRMNSIFRTVYWGAWPLGNLIGGYVGSVIGSRNSILAAGLLFGSLSFLFLLGPMRDARLKPPAAEATI